MRVIAQYCIILASVMITGCKRSSPPPGSVDYALINYTISEQQIPRQIMEIYLKETHDSPVVRAQLCLAGDRLMFYALRFRSDGRLREMTITPKGEVFGYDVSEKN